MGLDMYLSAAKYAHNFDNSPPEEKALYRKLLAEVGIARFRPIHNMPYICVRLLIASWKNAYQVNNWLVAHALGGEDIRQVDREVEREQLQELMDLCEQLLQQKDRKKAAALLPSPDCWLKTEDDWDYYWFHLEITVKQLGAVLNNQRFDGWEFFYEAS
jgi:hypothetical protein